LFVPHFVRGVVPFVRPYALSRHGVEAYVVLLYIGGSIRGPSESVAATVVAVVDCDRITIHNEVLSPLIYFYEFQYCFPEIPLDTLYNSIVIYRADSDERFEYPSRNESLSCHKSVELPRNRPMHGSISKRRTLSLIDATDTGGSVIPLESVVVVTT
jgi:hypothetical protein